MDTTGTFSDIFTKGDNFGDHLLLFCGSSHFENGTYSKMKEYAPLKQILSILLEDTYWHAYGGIKFLTIISLANVSIPIYYRDQ